jgi:transglutaminase-like putative cysteine protease
VAVPPALRVGLYLLLADGMLALYLGELLGPRGLGLVLTILAACLWANVSGLRVDPRWLVVRVIVAAAAVAALADVLYFAETILDGLARLLLFLVVYKLLTLEGVAETRAVVFLALFMLVAASSSAFGVEFLGVVVAFVGLGTWLAICQHVAQEAAPIPGRVVLGEATIPSRPLVGLAAVAAASVLVLTAGLFFVLPRVGLAALPFRARLGQMVTGFSDRVELGEYGSILTNEAVVMRVQLPDLTVDPARLGPLRWRGIALDEFDGRAWSVRHPRRTRVVRPQGGGFDVGVLRGTGFVLRQEILLEPIGSEAVFALPQALRLAYPSGVLAVDDMGSVTAPPPRGRLAYSVESEVEAFPRLRRRWPAPPMDPATLERYLQLPATLSERIPALARQVSAGAASPTDVARRLSDFLSREFRYTLTLEKVSDLDPLDEFLFVRRSGHCEYFAAALAVMLRSMGVPARVVNGFQQGEWNPHGRYFMVRLRDAHSWVEAYLPLTGWTTLDPSPRAAAEPPRTPSSFLLYLDALRLGWNRYVINWSLRDQVGVALTVRGRLTGVGPAFRDTLRAHAPLLGAALLLAGALGAAALAWRGGRGPAPVAVASPPAFYRRALRLLARRGLRPGAGETAREFERRVAGLGIAEARAFGVVRWMYERERFGGMAPAGAERGLVETSLETLRQRARAPASS